MNRIWLQSYPPGIPAEIEPQHLKSLAELVDHACKTYRDQPAYEQFGVTLTYRQLDDLSRAFAAWLQASGLTKGDRIAIMLPNCLQYPVVLFGALRAGLVVVNTNPLYTAREVQHQLEDSGALAVVVLENFAHVVQETDACSQLKRVLVTAVGDLLPAPKSWLVNYVVRHRRKQVPAWHIPQSMRLRDALRAGRSLQWRPETLNGADLAFLQYTGGTTGVAKGAMLTHGNLCANLLQALAWIDKSFSGEPGTLITAIPLYHVFALTANCLLFAYLGWRNVLIINARDFPALVSEMKRHPFEFFSGVNTLFNALLHTQGFSEVDFSHLKITLGGGMAVQAAVAQRWKDITGTVLTQAWGLTETSPAVAINPVGADFNGSVGLPIPSTEVVIKDEAGNDLPIGESGEVCVRGPQVMRGYWDRPEETGEVLLPDGWLRTGDIGYMDQKGYVYLKDRKKDMILVSGFNVYPNEVEDVAVTHPGILEAAAIAQPDEHSGEVVALFVVLQDTTITEKDIIQYCRKSLASYKVPRHVYIRSELPKSNVGKILRRELRAEFMPVSRTE